MHFCSVGTELGSKIPRRNRSPLTYIGQSSITLFYAGPASDTEVELIIGGINCRSWFPKSVPPIAFKRYARLITVAVSKLFNASIAEGQFPEILKIARVISMFKAGLREIVAG